MDEDTEVIETQAVETSQQKKEERQKATPAQLIEELRRMSRNVKALEMEVGRLHMRNEVLNRACDGLTATLHNTIKELKTYQEDDESTKD